jgi:iron complex outermembrane receptor protein
VRAYGTVVDAKFTSGPDDGKDVPLVPSYKAGMEIQLGLGEGFLFDSFATFTGKSRLGGDRANIASKLDDYIIVDVFLRYAPHFVKGLEAYVGVENVFDEQYASLGYVGMFEEAYYPGAGRSVRGGISLQF